MEYLKRPRFVSRDAVEYGYFPQDKLVELDDPVCFEEPYLRDENQLAVYDNYYDEQEQIFFSRGKFYYRKPGNFSELRWIYEYEPLLWRIYARRENLLYMISDRVLLPCNPEHIKDRFEIDWNYSAFEIDFFQYALFIEEDFLEPTPVGDDKALGGRFTMFQRVFAPSRAECQKMRMIDLGHRFYKPFLVTTKTRFSNKGSLCAESFGAPFLTSSFVGGGEKDQICFAPSKDGAVDFKTDVHSCGARPCIVIKEENIEKAY